MHTIKLNLINRSQDPGRVEIVMFQKNLVPESDQRTVAWRVVQNLGIDDFHPFDFPTQLQASTSDAYGNFTPLVKVYGGERWEMVQNTSGTVLQRSQKRAPTPSQVAITNLLPQGTINAHIFRDGKSLAHWSGITPQQQAVFSFNPSLWIGAVSQIQEGEVINSAIVSAIGTEISLLGVVSGDIVMTGGGTGPGGTPFVFSLENIVPQGAAD